MDASEESSRYERRVRDLEAFGHRGSATPNERAAAEYLSAELRAAGFEPQTEPFRGARSMAARLLTNVVPALVGAALLPRWPAVAAALTVVALASLIAEQMTRGVWLSRPVTRRHSQNVVARLPPARPAARRLVLLAHYDTQPGGWVWTLNRYLMPLAVHSPLLLKPPFTPVVFLMLAEVGDAAVAAYIGPSAFVRVVAGLILLAHLVLCVFLIQWSFGLPVPGAADNASGVAAVLAVAEAWRAAPPADDVELVVLLAGCEECGMLGAAAWADRHRDELGSPPTVFVNVDGVGFGTPGFLGAEVPAAGLPLHAPRRVLEQCAAAAAEQGLADAGPHALPGPTDGLALLARGLPGVTVVGFREGYTLPHYHTMQDTSANMDFAAALAGTRFARAVAWRLATGRGDGAGPG